jgi:hypothetical protein
MRGTIPSLLTHLHDMVLHEDQRKPYRCIPIPCIPFTISVCISAITYNIKRARIAQLV